MLDPENDEILLKYTEKHLLEWSLEKECSLLLRNRNAVLDGLHISDAHGTDIEDTLVMDLGSQSFLDILWVLPRLHKLVNDVRDAGLLSLVDHDYEAQKLWLLLRSLFILGSFQILWNGKDLVVFIDSDPLEVSHACYHTLEKHVFDAVSHQDLLRFEALELFVIDMIKALEPLILVLERSSLQKSTALESYSFHEYLVKPLGNVLRKRCLQLSQSSEFILHLKLFFRQACHTGLHEGGSLLFVLLDDPIHDFVHREERLLLLGLNIA